MDEKKTSVAKEGKAHLASNTTLINDIASNPNAAYPPLGFLEPGQKNQERLAFNRRKNHGRNRTPPAPCTEFLLLSLSAARTLRLYKP